MRDLEGKSILLGVTGGIAAYKAATIASLLVQAGASVDVVMTEAAQRFIQPLSFSAITHAPVHTDPFAAWHDDFTGHVGLARNADLLIIAPATAAAIARLALGLADDLLGSDRALDCRPDRPCSRDGRANAPPSSHAGAPGNACRARRDNRGSRARRLASGAIGEGRMASPESVVAAARDILRRTTRLAGKKIVITAGGTREPLDPVRYIGNRSSGAMGYALAAAALAAGADVTLISAETSLRPPQRRRIGPGRHCHRDAPRGRAGDARCRRVDHGGGRRRLPAGNQIAAKAEEDGGSGIPRSPPGAEPRYSGLDRPAKPAQRSGSPPKPTIIIENAAQKLAAKGLAMIVANDAESTIGAPNSTATILTADG